MRKLITGLTILFSLLMILVPANAAQVSQCASGTYPVAVSGTLTQNNAAITTVDIVFADETGELDWIGAPIVQNGFLSAKVCVNANTQGVFIVVDGTTLSSSVPLNTYVPRAAAVDLFRSITSFISTLAIRPATGVPNFLVDIFGGLRVRGNAVVDGTLDVDLGVIVSAPSTSVNDPKIACPAGKKATGGGCYSGGSENLIVSRPYCDPDTSSGDPGHCGSNEAPDGWHCRFSGCGRSGCQVWAVCGRFA